MIPLALVSRGATPVNPRRRGFVRLGSIFSTHGVKYFINAMIGKCCNLIGSANIPALSTECWQ